MIERPMCRFSRLVALLSWFLAGTGAAAALEIPLKQQSGQASGGGPAIGFVDMESVFQEFPETQKAKTEYHKELNARREALAQREKELSDLKEQLAVLRSTVEEAAKGASPGAEGTAKGASPGAEGTAKEPAVAPSTDTAALPGLTPEPSAPGMSPAALAAIRESVRQREDILKEKEASLEQARKEAADALKLLEERRSLQIFGKLYTALVQIADEEGIGLVVDKSSILYGQEAQDLTEKLRRRVRGLPPEE